MTEPRTIEASWETDANGMHTLIQRPVVFKARAVLRALAFAKMEGVFAITADFGGERESFEPLIEVRIERTDDVEFMSHYTSAFSRASEGRGLPPLCERRGKWVWSEDAMYFDQASDKGAYAATQQRLSSRIFFPTDESRIAKLVDRSHALFRAGVGLDQADRPNFPWVELSVRARQGSHLWSIEYSPRVNKNAPLEAWAEDWHSYFETLDSIPGIAPDKSCKVYYELSMADRLRAIGSWQESTKLE